MNEPLYAHPVAPAQAFDAAPFLREIGRGRDGARALAQPRARELMQAIVAGEISDLALGAVLLALRMKGEAVAEVTGFLDALEPYMARAPARAPGWVVIPSYNGARAAANLVPLLALLLARSGIPVLLHGQESEPAARARVTSTAILAALGHGMCRTMQDAAACAAAGLPAAVALSTFAPALSRLLALRSVLGVRNFAHTLAKLVRPVEGPCLLVTSYTHPDFGRLQAELFACARFHAMSMRGTDGEAVNGARKIRPIEYWKEGRHLALAQAPEAPPSVDLPAPDLHATVAWTRAVLEGRCAVPAGLQAQCDAIARAVHGGFTAPD